MEEFDIKNLQQKLTITDTAAQVYVKKGGSFTLHDIARQTDMNVGEILQYFSSKKEIIHFYYTSLIIRYRLMIDEIDDFKTFTLSEKFSNFAYASFDMMNEREKFVAQTFRSHVLHTCRRTSYENKIENLFSDFFKHDSGTSASSEFLINEASLRLLRKKYLGLVLVWLNDSSEGKEVSMELTDKMTGLLQEIAYTSVVDRTFDLAKFLYSNLLTKKNLPCWKKFSSKFEIK